MHPPVWICQALHQLHPQLRLGWAGRRRQHEEELNPGSFALVQLYHISDVGDLSDPETFRQPWDFQASTNGLGVTHLEHVERGPIFNRRGGSKRDWDSAFRVPIFVATLDESYGMDTEDITSGRFLGDIERWMVPIERRMREGARAKGKQVANAAEAVASEITKDLHRSSQKADEATVIMANKHAKPDLVEMDRRNEARGDLEDVFALPPVEA